MPSALIIASGAGYFPPPNDKKPAGAWAEEVIAPFMKFREAGFDVHIATPGAVPVPWTPRSVAEETKPEVVKKGLEDPQFAAKARQPENLAEEDGASFDIVFVAGGHGAAVDLAKSPDAKRVLETCWSSGKVLAAVCHGPAALLQLESGGVPIVGEGKRVCCFTNAEEGPGGVNMCDEVKSTMNGLLEDLFKAKGAQFVEAPPWTPNSVREGRLVTGQNPASSAQTAEKAIEAYKSECKKQEAC